MNKDEDFEGLPHLHESKFLPTNIKVIFQHLLNIGL